MVGKEKPSQTRPAESAGFFLPRGTEDAISPDLQRPKPNSIYYAGQSHRRALFLRTVLPDVPLHTFCVDPEPITPNLDDIVHHKLNVPLSFAMQKGVTNGLIVAADTQTIVTLGDNEGALRTVSKIKPTSEEDVMRLFRDMSEIPGDPGYIVQSGSGTHDIATGKRSEVLVEETRVRLDPVAVEYLGSDEGFQLYRSAFATFYGSEVYQKNNLPQIGICDISSGLSLPVLTKIGAVCSIDGIDRSNYQEFLEAFKKSLHVVAVGIHFNLLEGFPLGNWGWTEEVAQAVFL